MRQRMTNKRQIIHDRETNIDGSQGDSKEGERIHSTADMTMGRRGRGLHTDWQTRPQGTPTHETDKLTYEIRPLVYVENGEKKARQDRDSRSE